MNTTKESARPDDGMLPSYLDPPLWSITRAHRPCKGRIRKMFKIRQIGKRRRSGCGAKREDGNFRPHAEAEAPTVADPLVYIELRVALLVQARGKLAAALAQ